MFLSKSFENLGISISASASSLESAFALNTAKNLFLPSEFFLKKNRIFMFFLALSYSINTTLLQILISLRFPIHLSKDGHWCSRKRLFELSEASVHWCFKKITSRNVSAYIPRKHPGWSPFYIHSQRRA